MESEQDKHRLNIDEREELNEKIFGLENMKADNNWFL
jgi:hypothetical protein